MYVVLDVPQLFVCMVPLGDFTFNVKGELPLLTRQYTVTDVMLCVVPKQLPDDTSFSTVCGLH